jgi:L-gulonolactone oxidase
MTLARSDGTVRTVSAHEEPDLFRATVGGLGLTGLILTARLQLKAIPSLMMEVETIRYERLEDFFELAAESERGWEYTVAWVDTLAAGRQLGRGIFMRSRHARVDDRHAPALAEPRLSMPFTAPNFLLNPLTVTAFNAVYWRLAPRRPATVLQFYDPVFYPLDAIGAWNRMYGSRGFYQYQCAIPTATAQAAVRALLEAAARARGGSFLAVVKTLGAVPSPGLMSFPLAGATLALDLPNGGDATLRLLDRLDRITHEAGGRIYPAKDGRVAAPDFQAGFPQWRQLEALRDPKFSSSLWRRVSAEAGHG